jgi:hypothetical protein
MKITSTPWPWLALLILASCSSSSSLALYRQYEAARAEYQKVLYYATVKLRRGMPEDPFVGDFTKGKTLAKDMPYIMRQQDNVYYLGNGKQEQLRVSFSQDMVFLRRLERVEYAEPELGERITYNWRDITDLLPHYHEWVGKKQPTLPHFQFKPHKTIIHKNKVKLKVSRVGDTFYLNLPEDYFHEQQDVGFIPANTQLDMIMVQDYEYDYFVLFESLKEPNPYTGERCFIYIPRWGSPEDFFETSTIE